MHQFARRDSLGRRIGYNWWREYNNELFFLATAVWEQQCEAASVGYATEAAAFQEANPRPTLKDLLLGNKGMARPRDEVI